MKVKRITALLCSALAALSLAGCTFTSPATVGQVGETPIPSGLYLLLQMNAYSDAMSHAPADAKDVLSATLTVDEKEIGGTEYVAQKTHELLGDYAAVEQLFTELGGELDEQQLNAAKADAQSMWSANSALYTQNGVGEATVQTFVTYTYKRAALLELLYGADGKEPVSDKELADYINANYRRARCVSFPLLNYATYSALTPEDDATVTELANKAADRLKKGEEPSAIGKELLPQVYELLGLEYDAAAAAGDVEEILFSPSQMAYYGKDVEKQLISAKPGESLVADIGMSRVAMLMEPALKDGTIPADLRVSALSEMKKEPLNDLLTKNAEAMSWDLDESAMKTYSPKKIELA